MSASIRTARVGDPHVAEVISGQSPPSSVYNTLGVGLPFFQGKADFGLIHPLPRVWCDAGQKFARAGDVLLSVRAPVGDVNIAASDCVIGRGVAAIRPGPKTDQWFLYFALLHSKVTLEERATGSTFASINRSTLLDLEIPFPDEGEQTAIGALLRHVVGMIEREHRIICLAKDLKHATMHELFTDGSRDHAPIETALGSVAESWSTVAIGDIAVKTQYGLSVRGRSAGSYPILRMNCQEDGVVHYRDLQFVDLDESTFEAFRLHHGDLLFNRTNSIDLVGRMAIVDDDRPAVFASYLVRLTVDDRRCLPEFLNYFMNWPATQRDIKKLASRAVGQANINASKLRTVRLPLPALDEQHEIVAVLGFIDRDIAVHKRKRAALEDLFKSLLQKLMTGVIGVADLDLSALTQKAKAEEAA